MLGHNSASMATIGIVYMEGLHLLPLDCLKQSGLKCLHASHCRVDILYFYNLCPFCMQGIVTRKLYPLNADTITPSEMPTILDSLLHKVVNTTSNPIGVVGSSYSNIFIWPNAINSGCFQSYISQNVATSMSSLTSQYCGNSLLAVCLVR